jgi:hypothetical protein
MVQLEGSIRRYIGLSTDTKPERADLDSRGNPTGPLLPPGSSFFESDTFRISRWDGLRWTYQPDDARVLDALNVLIQEVRDLKAVHMEFFAKV